MFERTRRLLIIAIAALPLSASGQPRGASIIEAAPSGQPYDYVIHVKNTYEYRYNPQVRDDRILLAKKIVKPFCARNRIVGEAKFKTEIFGLVTGRPDYVVYVKCLYQDRSSGLVRRSDAVQERRAERWRASPASP